MDRMGEKGTASDDPLRQEVVGTPFRRGGNGAEELPEGRMVMSPVLLAGRERRTGEWKAAPLPGVRNGVEKGREGSALFFSGFFIS